MRASETTDSLNCKNMMNNSSATENFHKDTGTLYCDTANERKDVRGASEFLKIAVRDGNYTDKTSPTSLVSNSAIAGISDYRLR